MNQKDEALAKFKFSDIKCTSPLYIKNESFEGYVPCKKCLVCRKNKSKEWGQRILFEVYEKECCFLTLTYSDEYVRDINKRDIQLFMKKLRKKIPGKNLKYFCCGEYGERTNRPHYHMILIGWQPYGYDKKTIDLSSQIIGNTWGLGNVHIGSCTPSSINYVTGYMLKDNGFRLMSKNMGKDYAIRFKEQIKNSDKPIANQLLKYINFKKEYYAELGDEKLKELCEKYGIDNISDYIKSYKDRRIYRDLLANAKNNIYQRGNV